MPAPLYSDGNVVYFVESAALGFLEAFTISRIESRPNVGWVYILGELRSSPTQTFPTLGDRITNRTSIIREYRESELTNKCGALALIKANLESRLLEVNSLLAACNG